MNTRTYRITHRSQFDATNWFCAIAALIIFALCAWHCRYADRKMREIYTGSEKVLAEALGEK